MVVADGVGDREFAQEFEVDEKKQSDGYAARSPNGNLRQYKLMKPEKLLETYNLILIQNNDPEAIRKYKSWMRQKGLID